MIDDHKLDELVDQYRCDFLPCRRERETGMAVTANESPACRYLAISR